MRSSSYLPFCSDFKIGLHASALSGPSRHRRARRLLLDPARFKVTIVMGADGSALPAIDAKEGKLDIAAIISSVLTEIEPDLSNFQAERIAVIPPTTSPWLAVALLQKSIRRGRTDYALAAADLLLRVAPDRLWWRLSVIAVEDVGLGNLDAVFATVAIAAQHRNLCRRFGAKRVAGFIVSRLASAPKCRATDDLFSATEGVPAWREDRLELADRPFGDLMDIITGPDAIERRAIALRFALGTARERHAGNLARRRGHPQSVFEALSEIAPPSLATIAREAYRQTGEAITGFLPLLWSSFDGAETELRDDPLPPETTVAGLPGWTFDMFSREGRAVLGRFVQSDAPTANWLRLHVPPRDRLKIAGGLLFRIESGLVTDRLIWPTGVHLRQHADLHAWPFPPDDAATALNLMQRDIPVLNAVREACHGR